MHILRYLAIWLMFFFLILSSQPFYIWNTPVQDVSTLGLLIVPFLWPRRVNKKKLFCFFCLFLCFVYFGFYQSAERSQTLFGISATLLCPAVFLIKKEYLKSVYDKYCFFFAISIIPSLIVYFLVVWFDVSLPAILISPLNKFKDYNYLQYPFCVIPEGLLSLRFHGYYDEPGVIGSIAGVLLIVNGWNLKDWKNWPIAIAGFFSFSLFFVLISVFYFVFFTPFHRGKIIFVTILMAIAFLINGNDDLNRISLSRMEFKDGKLSGDTRTTKSFDLWYNDYISSNRALFGYGYGKNQSVNFGGASYKDLIVNYGIIINLLFYLSVFMFCLLNYGISRKTAIWIFCFLAMMYQRPFITNILYLFLMIAPMCNASSIYPKKDKRFRFSEKVVMI